MTLKELIPILYMGTEVEIHHRCDMIASGKPIVIFQEIDDKYLEMNVQFIAADKKRSGKEYILVSILEA